MMDREKVTKLALAAGFEPKLLANGEMGLREYVYAFAKAIEAEKDAEAKEFLDAAIADARHFEKQRDDLLEVVHLVREDLLVGASDDLELADRLTTAIEGIKGADHG